MEKIVLWSYINHIRLNYYSVIEGLKVLLACNKEDAFPAHITCSSWVKSGSLLLYLHVSTQTEEQPLSGACRMERETHPHSIFLRLKLDREKGRPSSPPSPVLHTPVN